MSLLQEWFKKIFVSRNGTGYQEAFDLFERSLKTSPKETILALRLLLSKQQ